MARQLVSHVHVAGRVFAPGDKPAKEFADQITNPKAWGEEPEETPAPSAETEPTTTPAGEMVVDGSVSDNPPAAKKATAKRTAAKKTAAAS